MECKNGFLVILHITFHSMWPISQWSMGKVRIVIHSRKVLKLLLPAPFWILLLTSLTSLTCYTSLTCSNALGNESRDHKPQQRLKKFHFCFTAPERKPPKLLCINDMLLAQNLFFPSLWNSLTAGGRLKYPEIPHSVYSEGMPWSDCSSGTEIP